MKTATPDAQGLVDSYYSPLYRFALSLAKSEADAADLTQQTFYRWAMKGDTLRDGSKVKSWLFTTLYREFLQVKRKTSRYQCVSMELVESELPSVSSRTGAILDSQAVIEAMPQVDRRFRLTLSLFYFKQYSYKEIAEALDIPIGTVMSRISRGKKQLRKLLEDAPSPKG